MEKKNRLIVVYALLICSMILWGSSFVWGKIALEYYNAITVIFFRLFISVIFLIPVLLIARKFILPKRKHLHLFMLLALFEPFLYFLGETNGLNYVDPSMTAVIISVIPLFTPFVAYYFLGERISVLNLIGIVISISGIIFLVFGKDMSLEVPIKGLLLLFLAIVAANGYSVMIKKIPDEYSVLTVIFWQNVIGMLYFLPIAMFYSIDDVLITGFVSRGFWAIAELGILASTLAFLFYMYGLKFMPITKVNVFTNVIPIFTIIISYLFFDEQIGFKKIAGILIVVSGVILSQLGKTKKKN
ncbi:MAG TPA: DMT family transporter [Bacteroidales bacterium]|nr:DMT family transporter [Bacteroidales bacterium]